MNTKQWGFVLSSLSGLLLTNGALVTNWHDLLVPQFVIGFIAGIVGIFGAALSPTVEQDVVAKKHKKIG